MKSLLLLLLVILFLPTRTIRAESAEDRAKIARIEKILHHLIIPRLEFRQATFPEALNFLKKKSVDIEDRDPEEPSAFAPLSIPSTTPATPENTTADAPATEEKRITLSLRDVSLYDALQKITTTAGVKFWIRADGVHTSLHEPEPMLTRDFRVPRGLIKDMEATDPADRLAQLWKNDVQGFLVMNGVVFDKPAAAILNNERTRLTVHNTEDQLELIETILKSFAKEADAPATPLKTKLKTRSAAKR